MKTKFLVTDEKAYNDDHTCEFDEIDTEKLLKGQKVTGGKLL